MCADVHFQAIVLAERFVTVGALVWTLTCGTKDNVIQMRLILNRSAQQEDIYSHTHIAHMLTYFP